MAEIEQIEGVQEHTDGLEQTVPAKRQEEGHQDNRYGMVELEGVQEHTDDLEGAVLAQRREDQKRQRKKVHQHLREDMEIDAVEGTARERLYH
jgi:hypothetical protein